MLYNLVLKKFFAFNLNTFTYRTHLFTFATTAQCSAIRVDSVGNMSKTFFTHNLSRYKTEKKLNGHT